MDTMLVPAVKHTPSMLKKIFVVISEREREILQ